MSQNLSRRQLLRAGLAGSATLAAAAVHAAPAGLYKPGTYTAKAAGIAGDVRVSMTFETDRIVDVVIDASSETPSIGQAAAEKLKKAPSRLSGCRNRCRFRRYGDLQRRYACGPQVH